MNHLIIYGKDFTSEDKDFIIKVLSYTAIPLGMVKFVDINAVDSFLPSKLNFCFNNTHGIVARSVCSKEGYKAKEFLTGNVIFHNDKFAFFNVPASLREIRASDKLKDDLWGKVQILAQSMTEFGYIDENTSVKETSDETTNTEQDLVTEEDIQDATTKQSTSEESNTRSTTDGPVIIEIEDIVNSIVSEIKFDATSGKSLQEMKKIVIHTKDGETINIYPTMRINTKDEGIHVNFKDMISLIKFSLMVGSKNIEFYKE